MVRNRRGSAASRPFVLMCPGRRRCRCVAALIGGRRMVEGRWRSWEVRYASTASLSCFPFTSLSPTCCIPLRISLPHRRPSIQVRRAHLVSRSSDAVAQSCLVILSTLAIRFVSPRMRHSTMSSSLACPCAHFGGMGKCLRSGES